MASDTYTESDSHRVYEFGPFRLDQAERRLSRNGDPVSLTPKVFDTLLLLIQNAGHLVDKEELMKAIWPDSFVEEANLNRSISTLRRVLGEAPTGPRYIETVPKRGYRFVAAVTESEKDDLAPQTEIQESAQAAEGLSPVRLDVPADSSAKPIWRRGWLALALASMALISGLVYVFAFRKSSAVEAAPEVKSLAVLPFKSIGSGSEDETLQLGMADTLITRLSNVRGIKVRPTSAVLKYSSADYDPIGAGRALRADAVLEGSVQKVEDRIRITVRLFRVTDETPLWSGAFDESVKDLLSIEDSISERVVQALRLNLGSGEREALISHQTSSAQAYEYYMKGRYFWNQRSRDGLIKATEYFEKAIRDDPSYTQAYAGLADCYALRANNGNFERDEGYSKAKAVAKKALELDDHLAEAHASLGFILELYDWDWQGAETQFKRAIELNPNYATAHQWYGQMFGRMGKRDDAIREAKLAQELDPLSPVIYEALGNEYFYNGQFDQAIEQYQRALEIAPDFWSAHRAIVRLYAYKGLYREALEEYRRIGSKGVTTGHLSVVHTRALE